MHYTYTYIQSGYKAEARFIGEKKKQNKTWPRFTPNKHAPANKDQRESNNNIILSNIPLGHWLS